MERGPLAGRLLATVMAIICVGAVGADHERTYINPNRHKKIEHCHICLLPDDILIHVFRLIGDIKSDALPEEVAANYTIDIDNWYQTFNGVSKVALLPLVCKRFNHIVETLRNSSEFPYIRPKIIIPVDLEKVRRTLGRIDFAAIAPTSLFALTASSLAMAHLSFGSQSLLIAELVFNGITILLAIPSVATSVFQCQGGCNTRFFFSAITALGSIASLVLLACSISSSDRWLTHLFADIVSSVTGVNTLMGCCCYCINHRQTYQLR